MRVEDWFGLALRVVGVYVLIAGLGLLLDALLLKLGYFNLPDTHPAYYLIYGGAQVVAGLYLVRGAPFLVGFAFLKEEDDEEGAEEELEQNNPRKL